MNWNEYKCRCGCGTEPEIPKELHDKIDDLELLVGALHATCGYRCPEHNKKVGGVDSSTHVKGMAMDLYSRFGVKPETIAEAAERVGFGGIHAYPEKNFCHVDIGTKRRW